MNEEKLESILREYYNTHNPGNTQNILEIIKKYNGKIDILGAKLYKKYGIAPNFTEAKINIPKNDTSIQNIKYDEHYHPYRLYKIPVDSYEPFYVQSPRFNPLEALNSNNSMQYLPYPNALPLDNIQKCRYLLPKTNEFYAPQRTITKTLKVTTEYTEKKNQKTYPTYHTIIDRVADLYVDAGPLSILYRCFTEKKRVIVAIRRVNSIRGTCIGYLKGFDKHMNLVLLDVLETVIPLNKHEERLKMKRKGEDVMIFSIANSKTNKTFTERKHIKQLFIRGDNVVLVAQAP